MEATLQPSDNPPNRDKGKKMKTVKINSSVKIYQTMAKCSRYQHVKAGYIQPVFDEATQKPLGFAALPEKVDGEFVKYVK